MHIEYEVRILNINKEEMKKKLESLGAEFTWESLQQRYVYDFNPIEPKKWIRLRKNQNKTTLTIKNIISSNIDGTEELEIEVSDFENTNKILNELGYKPRSFQENNRCRYYLDGIEIDIDSWPKIPDYIEIEGSSEEEVMNIVKKLGYEKSDVTALDVDSIYKDYGIDLNKIDKLELERERL